MAGEIIIQELLNQNSQRSYPLMESATKTDRSGTFILPDDILLSVYLPIHAGLAVDPNAFFLQVVSAFGVGYTFAIGYDDGSASPPTVASAQIPKETLGEYDFYDLIGKGDFRDVKGKLVVGAPEAFDQLAAGRYEFDFAGGKLDPDCIWPTLQGVSGIEVVNGQEVSARLTGDIRFTAYKNCRIDVAIVEGEIPELRFSAIDGEGTVEDCDCTDDRPCIKTISGVGPDNFGNIALLGDSCLQVETGAASINLRDDCSSPCCGAENLKRITDDLQAIFREWNAFKPIVSRLSAEVSATNMTVLSSNLKDVDGCFECS